MSRPFGALQVAHQFIESHVRPGAFCIDATAGRGNDTVFLASLVGETGKVLAFDIQPEAVESTRALIGERGCSRFYARRPGQPRQYGPLRRAGVGRLHRLQLRLAARAATTASTPAPKAASPPSKRGLRS